MFCLTINQLKCGTLKSIIHFTKGGNLLRTHPTRYIFTPRYGAKYLQKYKLKDKVPEDFLLVYRHPVISYINGAQIASLAIGSGLVAMWINSGYFLSNVTDFERPTFGPKTTTELAAATCGLVFAIIAMQYVSMKSPVRIYSNGTKFIAIRNSVWGPVKKRSLVFNAGAAEKSKPSSFSVWNDCRYNVNGHELIIFEHQFRSNADYNKMMRKQVYNR